MSSDNIERTLEGFRAMERGDLDAIVALADPDVKFVNPDYALEPGTREGPDGLRAGLGAILDVFEDLRFKFERVVELGDRVLTTGTFTARGKGSGMAFEPSPFAILITLRDERVVRFEWFIDADEAERAGKP